MDKKEPSDPNKSKKKKKKQISPTNTLSSIDTKTQTNNQKIFKIKDTIRTIKKKKTTSKAQNASLSHCKIEQGYKRKSR